MRTEQQIIWNAIKLTELLRKPCWLNILKRFGFTEQEENEVCDLIYYEQIDLKLAHRHYQQNEEQKVRQQVKDFIAEFQPEFVEGMRKNYLEGQVARTKQEMERVMVAYQNSYKFNEPIEKRKSLGDLFKDKQKQYMRAKDNLNYSSRVGAITGDMITQAKKVPMEKLMTVNSAGFATCPFHQEKTPSMYVKKNFYHCFSCMETGDTIDYIQKTKKLDFPSAVRDLLTY